VLSTGSEPFAKLDSVILGTYRASAAEQSPSAGAHAPGIPESLVCESLRIKLEGECSLIITEMAAARGSLDNLVLDLKEIDD
jgi:hypothetical protein